MSNTISKCRAFLSRSNSRSGSDDRIMFLGWYLFASLLFTIGAAAFSSEVIALTIIGIAIVIWAVYIMILAVVRRLNDLKWNRWIAMLSCVPIANAVMLFTLLFTTGKSNEASRFVDGTNHFR